LPVGGDAAPAGRSGRAVADSEPATTVRRVTGGIASARHASLLLLVGRSMSDGLLLLADVALLAGATCDRRISFMQQAAKATRRYRPEPRMSRFRRPADDCVSTGVSPERLW
jgi:hypothetical protein